MGAVKYQFNVQEGSNLDYTEGSNGSKFVRIRKVWVYLLACLFVVILAVAVGVLVWHFVSSTSTDDGREVITKTTPNPNIGMIWDHYRLPRDVIPSHYNLTLYPDFYEDNAWFWGSETIEVEVVRPTQFILIHYRNINITDTAIVDVSSGQSVEITRNFTYTKYDYLVLEFAQVYKRGTLLTVSFTFQGSLAEKRSGLYKTTYTTLNWTKRHMVATQMDPAFAREVFPCFDEPDMKANFSVTLIHKPGYSALSNMPEQESGPSDEYPGLVRTSFQTSFKMSIYLLAVVVCDFDHIQNITGNGHLVSIDMYP